MIRLFEPADADGVAALPRQIAPAWVISARGALHWIESQPERARLATWVALLDGEVVGYAEARLRWEFEGGSVSLFVGVDRSHRRRGLGAQLYELAEAHIADAPRIYCETTGEEEGRRFLAARGFRDESVVRVSVLDPRKVDLSTVDRFEAEKAAEGFRVVTLAEIAHRAAELHRLHRAVEADAPWPEPLVEIGFEGWRKQVLEAPDLDEEASVVVVAPDGGPVALSWLAVDRAGGRAAVEMTGTLREFRRRGLARLAKLATIRWAVDHGITAMYTGNDLENPAMLALNEELGFEPRILEREMVKERSWAAAGRRDPAQTP